MKQNKKKNTLIIVGFIVVVTILVFILTLFLNPKEAHISNTNTTEVVSAISCYLDDSADAFFHNNAANSERNEIKFTILNDKVDKSSLTFTGTYSDEGLARDISSELHAKYNLYMDSTPIDFSALSPNFSVIDNQVIVSLFFNNKTLTRDTLNFLFLSEDDFQSMNDYSPTTLKNYYENKNFSCKTVN